MDNNLQPQNPMSGEGPIIKPQIPPQTPFQQPLPVQGSQPFTASAPQAQVIPQAAPTPPVTPPPQPAPQYDWNRYEVPKPVANRFVETGDTLDNSGLFNTASAPTPLTTIKASALLDLPSHKRFIKHVLMAVAVVVLLASGATLASLKNSPASTNSNVALTNPSSSANAFQTGLNQALLKINRDTQVSGGKTFTATGPVIIQDENNSASVFKIQNAAGNNLFIADTINNRVGIGTTPSGTAALQVSGDISSNGKLVTAGGVSLGSDGLRIGNTLVCSARGCISSSSPAPSPTNPSLDVANVAFLNAGQTFIGNNKFSGNTALNNASGTFSGNGSGLTGVNADTLNGQPASFYQDASNLNSGTLSDTRLSNNITRLGNNFNGAGQLVQLDSSGLLPALNGSALTNVNALTLQGNGATYFTDATNISSGTLNDARLSANVALRTADNSFSGINTFSNAGNSFTGNGAGVSNVDAAKLNGQLGSYYTNASNISSGTLSDNRLSANVALLNANDDFTSIVKIKNTSTAAFQVQKADGTGNLLVTDTTNGRVAIGQASATYTLDVNGTINTATGFRVAGVAGASVACSGGQFIQDITSSGGLVTGGTCTTPSSPTTPTFQQVYSASVTSPQLTLNGSGGGLVIQDAASTIGGNLFAIQSNGGVAKYLAVTTSGANVAGNIDITGNYKVNGVQITSANLGNDSLIPKLNTGNIFSGSNTFSSSSNSFTGDGAGLANVDAAKLNGQTGSYYTNATNISSGTLNDARLSSNVALLNANNSFSGNNNFTGTVTTRNTSATAFQIQNAGATNNLFIADTTNSRIAIGQASAAYTLDVNGIINSATGFRVAGIAGTNLSCNAGESVQNATISGGVVTAGSCVGTGAAPTLQSIYNASVTSPQVTLSSANGGLILQDAASTVGGNLLAVQSNGGGTKYLAVTTSGISVGGSINTTGTYQVGGVQISTTNLSDGASITKQGNSFNGVSQLVLTDGSGKLPALDGSAITNVNAATLGGNNSAYFTNATNLSSGTVNDARLSSNVALKNANNTLSGNNTFTGNNTFQLNSTAFNIQDNVTPLAATLFGVTNSTGSTNYFSVSATGAKIGTNDVCTTAGNCAGAGTSVTTAGGTAGKIAKFTGSQAIGDSLLSESGGTVTVGGTLAVNTITPTSTLTVGTPTQTLTLQGDASTKLTAKSGSITNQLVFATPTVSGKTITIPDATGTVAVSASGPLALDAAGNITCPTCLTSGGGGGTAGVSSLNTLTGALTLAGTANQIVITPSGGTTLTFSTPQDIDVTATPTFANLNVGGGQFRINGTQITSAALSNDSNLTKNSAGNTLTGANSFAPTTDIVGATVKQTTAASPTSDVFAVTSSNGLTKYLAVTSAGTVATSGTLNAAALQQGGVGVVLQNTSFSGDISGAYNATAIGTGKVTSTHILDGTIANIDINAAAGIAYSKLNLAGSIVNADISSSAAIGYSKLSLSNSVVNSDIAAAAAIAYSKLSLSNSIVNADINTTAAIAYSKLSLSNSIVNADIAAGAAIADSKLAQLTTANKVADSALSSNVALLNANNTFTGTNLLKNTGTTAFQIQKADGSGTVFVADTTNTRLAVGQSTANYTLDVAGDVNLSSGSSFRINGVAICTSAGCSSSGGSGSYIQNGTGTQSANFNVRSAATGNIAAVIEAASGQSVDVMDVQSFNGTTKYLAVTSTGNITASGTFNAATLQQGGTAVVLQNTNFGGDVSGTYNAIAIGTGKVTGTNILDGTIANIDINAAAAIAYSKLSLSNSIVNADIAAGAAIADSKLAQLTTANKVADSALSTNVALINANNIFSGNNTFSGTVLGKNTATAAFQLQKADGSGTVFTADTTNTRVAIAQGSAAYTLDVNGDVNVTSGHTYKIAGTDICTTSGCTAASGSGNYIQNTSSPQTANFNITGSGTVGALTVQSSTNSATSLQVLNSAGTAVTTTDTLNMQENVVNLQATGTISLQNAQGASIQLRTISASSTGLTLSGNEITDATRSASIQGDGRQPPDTSTGIWESTTNLIPNGGAESSLNGFIATNGNSSVSRVTSVSKFGSAGFQASMVGATTTSAEWRQTDNSTRISVLGSTTYTLSFWVRTAATYSGRTGNARIDFYNAGGTQTGASVNGTSTNLSTGWTRISATGTSASDATTARLFFNDNGANTGDIYYLDGGQFEQKAIATPYVETNGGTASRAAARVQAPSSLTNITQGWAAIRFRANFASTSTADKYLFSWGDASNHIEVYWLASQNAFEIQRGANGNFTTAGGAFGAGTTFTIVGRWTSNTTYVSVNGGVFGTGGANSNTTAIAAPTMNFGTYNDGSQPADGDILWASTGTGTLVDADAATINRYGNSDPTMTNLSALNSGAASPTFAWDGAGKQYSGTNAAYVNNSQLSIDDVKLSHSANGSISLQGSVNSTTALNVQNASGTSILDVDTTNGFVGIATTSPGYELEVKGNGSATDGIYINTSSYASVPNAGTISNKIVLNPRGLNITADNATITSTVGTGLGIAVNRAGAALAVQNASGYSAIFESGNVGIGNTAPGNPLTVKGVDAAPASSGTVSTGFGRFYGAANIAIDIGATNSSPFPGWIQVHDASNQSINYPLVLNPNGGNVGVGETPALFRLQASTSIAVDTGSNTYVTMGIDPAGSSSPTTYGGLYFDASKNLRIEALSGGVAWRNIVLQGQGSGNVGIGVTTPQAKLNVIGQNVLGTSDLLFTYDNTGNYRNGISNAFFAGTAASNKLQLRVSDGTVSGQVAVMTLQGDGNVGLGNSSLSSWGSGLSVLQIGYGGGLRATTAAAGSGTVLSNNQYYNGTTDQYIDTARGASQINQHNGIIDFQVAAAGANPLTFTTAFSIGSDGITTFSKNVVLGSQASDNGTTNGSIYYNSTNGKFRCYEAGSWKNCIGGGISSYSTTLPGSPVDGQETVLVDSTTNPSYQWHFRYNTSSTSAYKWEYVGGTPVVRTDYTNYTPAPGAWANSAAQFTLPVAGDWIVSTTGSSQNVCNNSQAYYIGVGATGAGASIQEQNNSSTNAIYDFFSMNGKLTSVASGTVLAAKMYTGACTNSNWTNFNLTIEPARVN